MSEGFGDRRFADWLTIDVVAHSWQTDLQNRQGPLFATRHSIRHGDKVASLEPK